MIVSQVLSTQGRLKLVLSGRRTDSNIHLRQSLARLCRIEREVVDQTRNDLAITCSVQSG